MARTDGAEPAVPSADGSLAARIEQVSATHLGKPYTFGPLGEGPKGDVSTLPLWRDDTFDCTTFVETVLARSHSQSQADFECLMNRIRYQDGKVSYLDRRHLADAEWIPYQEKTGLLRDITKTVAGSKTGHVEDTVSRGKWLKSIDASEIKRDIPEDKKQKIVAGLHAAAGQYAPVHVRLDYVPMETLLKDQSVLDKIPSGTVFNVVRRGKHWVMGGGAQLDVESLISHQGFLIRKDGRLYMRHANRFDKKVVDVELEKYVQRMKDIVDPASGGKNILGYNLLAPQARPTGLCAGGMH